jgi:hypothetical protein
MGLMIAFAMPRFWGKPARAQLAGSAHMADQCCSAEARGDAGPPP